MFSLKELSIQEKKMLYFGDKSDIFLLTIATAYELKSFKVAFETLEKAKSKYFLEMLQRKSNDPFNNSINYEVLINQLEKEESINEIFKLKKKINKHSEKMKIKVQHLTFEEIKKTL